jgi:dipeptidyl aminopeptidase/acylaminoacyl peptidase
MHDAIKLEEKYERNGWPSLARPDVKPPSGWSLSLITAVDRVRHHALAPDGTRIAFIWDRADQSDVYVMPATGGWPGRVSTRRALSAYWADEVPQWSPDSAWLAFTIDGHVHVAPAAGGIPRKISDFAPEASSPVWMPDSNRLIVSVERDDRTQLVLTDRDGAWPRSLVTAPGGDAWDARPTPDGTAVAFVWRPFDDLNRHDIHLVDVASGDVRPLTDAAKTRDWSPRWSPDGAMLAFLSERSGFDEVWLMDRDGDRLRRLTHLEADVTDIAWSPDGTQLACTVNRGGAFELAVIAVGDGSVRTVRGGQGFHSRPRWTPDNAGLTVEYEDPVTPPDLYRVDVASGAAQQLTFSNPPALAANTLVIPEVVSYRSFDGLEIPAFLYRPAKPNGAAVVYPHGGPSSQYIYEWDIWAQYLVAKGYTYLAPNYRGSTGYGRAFTEANHFDWGGGDLQDCLYAARFLHTLDGIDPTRIASAGGSYGGYLTAGVLSRDPDYLYACGVAEYGDMELIASWAQCNRDLRLYVESFLGHPADRRAVYVDGSTIFQVEQVQKPVLILHGLLDTVVAPETSEQWVEALRRHDKVFEYKTYAGEPHGFLMRKTRLDAFTRIERFLDWYLLPR